ncbi:hypothetical protein [Pseudonocardia broussonetiae]|nr:hypothetical protein [Pseudonocardia broussonetiae]
MTAGTRPRIPMTAAQVAGIDARIRYYRLPWWRRLRTRRPPRWEW